MPATADVQRRRPWVRRIASWTVPAVALGGLAAAGVRLVLPSAEAEVLRSLSPDAPGATWVYRTETNGEPSGLAVSQIVGTSIFSDGDRVVPALVVEATYEDYAGLGPATFLSYRGRVGREILSFGRRVQGGDFQPADPPQPVLRSPANAGTAWSWEGTEGDTASGYEARVVALEDVDVLGERRTGCAHVRFDYTFENGTEVGEEWLCPGIGTVRTRNVVPNQDLTFETLLAEVHLPGESGGAGRPGLSEVTDPGQGAVQGIGAARSNSVRDATLDPSRVVWNDVRRGNALFPPVGEGGRFVLAEEDGTVTVTYTPTGEVLWRVRLRGPIVASPVLAWPLVLAADAQKALFALDADTGAVRWVARFPDLVSAGPLVDEGTVVVTTEDRGVHAFAATDGAPLWDGETGDLVKAPPALAAGHAVIADEGGGVTAFALDDGATIWSAGLEGALTAGPVAAGGAVIAADDAGYLTATNAESGETRWRRFLGAIVTSEIDPAATGDAVIVPEESFIGDDFLAAYALADGTRRWRVRARGPLATPPVIVGETVAVQTANARLVSYALADGRVIDERDLPRLDDDASYDSDDVGPAWIDGVLVASVRTFAPWGATSYVALSAPRGDAASLPGVRFRGSVRTVGIAWRSPPIRVGDTLVMSDSESVVALPPTGSPRVLAEESSPWLAAAGGGVLAHLGTDLVLLDPRTGERWWSMDIGGPPLGARAVIDGGAAYVPTADGLLAVDVATGAMRWRYPVSVEGIGHPLPLPGGDVVYGGGDIARLDVRTGEPRWRIPGLTSYGPLAEADGAVFVQGSSDAGSELLAIGADDGDVRWRMPMANALLLGPAVVDGVVIAVDRSGNAFGVGAEGGETRWTRAARTAACGSPVALGDRVAILEGGRLEDIQERDYRVTVLDSGTGRYLGSVEPDGTSGVPGDCAAVGDTLLMPGSLSAQELRVEAG